MPTRTAFCLLSALAVLGATFLTETSYATKYGAGSYGRCQYQTCAISMSSSNTVSVNITPANTGVTCSVAADSVTVTTSSSTGYKLTLIDNDTATNLTSSGSTIPTTTATYASPAVLTANKWGYRVDSQGNFGAGPTSAVTNSTVPTVTFAGLQPSSGTADTLVNATTAATNGVTTKVWYGVCINASQQSGAYSDAVLYTALVN